MEKIGGMRKRAVSIDEIKKDVLDLKGKELRISINKGRKKIVRYEGEITDIYPSVFVLRINNDHHIKMLSFSYSDVICGDIKLKAT